MRRCIFLALATIVLVAGCVQNTKQPVPDSISDGFLPGNNAWVHTFTNYGRTLNIIEYRNVSLPAFSGLLSFLKEDAVNNTGECSMTGNNCVDFAARLHNNAESCGINCSIMTFWYRDNEGRDCDHAINAFLTTDRGIVFVDGRSRDERLVFLNLSTREYGYCKLDNVTTVTDYDSCRSQGNYCIEGETIGGLSFMDEYSAEEARKRMTTYSRPT